MITDVARLQQIKERAEFSVNPPDDITFLLSRLEKAEAALNVCWHCGVVFAEAIKPRCEDCPAECDDENCDAMGCIAAAALGKESK